MARRDTPATLAADMLKAAGEAVTVTRAVVKKGAQNIKTEGRKNAIASAPVQNAHAPYAITYDTTSGSTKTSIVAEIGYDKDLPGGDLGNLLEYGSRNNPPHRDLGRALDVETPRFETVLAEAAMRLL
jgi:hypothetical protein